MTTMTTPTAAEARIDRAAREQVFAEEAARAEALRDYAALLVAAGKTNNPRRATVLLVADAYDRHGAEHAGQVAEEYAALDCLTDEARAALDYFTARYWDALRAAEDAEDNYRRA
jgi:hypothetical protein